MKIIAIFLIDFYRSFLSFDTGLLSFLAPGGACRQNPTCSLYTRQMIVKYGLIRGLVLGGRRIIKCR